MSLRGCLSAGSLGAVCRGGIIFVCRPHTAPYDALRPEEIVRGYTGLTRGWRRREGTRAATVPSPANFATSFKFFYSAVVSVGMRFFREIVRVAHLEHLHYGNLAGR